MLVMVHTSRQDRRGRWWGRSRLVEMDVSIDPVFQVKPWAESQKAHATVTVIKWEGTLTVPTKHPRAHERPGRWGKSQWPWRPARMDVVTAAGGG